MLLTARDIEKSYGPRLLFSHITLGLAEGERVGLIGANGSGKSTMLRIFAGLEHPDAGELIAARQLRVGLVMQEEQFDPEARCDDIVAAAVDAHLDDHERHDIARRALERAGFADMTATAGGLSGGWRKRLAVVRQLVRDPQLLLMDEPTNHLDVEGIQWLERLIADAPFATLIVSHDRRFLESVVNRVVELGQSYPDGYLSHNGTYTEFLEKRAEFLDAQQGRQQALASGVRREIEWLRRGAKARTTKAKGRIERAGDMMAELDDLKKRNAVQTGPAVDFVASDRRTKKLIELKGVAKSLGGRMLFSKLDLKLSPRQRLGLLGPNGSGKSTLIRILNGQLEPDAGSVFRAEQLRVVVFDQHRRQLDPRQTLRRALAPNGDQVKFQGRFQHVSGWAQRFCFRTEQLDMPVSSLSGGEQARVLIARLMLEEADVLILDEPTNDLDILTLDVLESSLRDFEGALVLVTHDRYLLEAVSTELLALDGRGGAAVYASLDQWERAQSTARRADTAPRPVTKPAPKADATTPVPRKKLKWAEQRELDGMEEAILTAEGEVVRLQEQAADPAVTADHVKANAIYQALGEAQQQVDRLYARWSELSALTEPAG